jgi:tetratricopeptide (TPR) repeat protein
MKAIIPIVLLVVLAGCPGGDDRLDAVERDLDAGRFVEAREALLKIYGAAPGSPRAALLLSRAHRECGDADAARRTLGSLSGPDAESVAATIEKVRVLLAISDHERELGRKRRAGDVLVQAREMGRTLTKGSRPGAESLLLAADVELLLGARAKARTWLEEARIAGADEVEAETREAVLLARSGDLPEAVKRVEALAERTDGDARALFTLGRLELWAKRPQRARQHLAAAARADPAHPLASVRLARMLVDSGKELEAVDVLRPHLKRRPDDLSALLMMSRALAKVEHWAAAVDTMRHAAAVHDNEPAVMNNLGVILYEGAIYKNEWVAQAIAVHEAALKLAPDDVMNAYNLGRCWVKRNKTAELERLIPLYENLLVRTAGSPALFFEVRKRIHRNLALVYSDSFQRWEDAYRHYEAFFKMGGEREDEGILAEWDKVLTGLNIPYRAPPMPDGQVPSPSDEKKPR